MLKAFFIILFSVNIIFASNYQEIPDTSNLILKNPSMKERKTLKLRLNNGLRVLLVSDKNADKSAAALGVAVGAWDDPIKYQGTAHFCEHMLFMGSKKYPDPRGFVKYITDNSGDRNAYTSFDKTVYMFQVNTSALNEALDRLSHFFIDPLFDPTCISKELYAIDQEHSKNIENDHRRAWMITKEIGNPDHPNVKFSTGNSDTLKTMPPEELVNWYKKNYSSNLMVLVIYSPLDINVLKQMAIENFSKIQNIGKDPLNTKETYFLKKNLSKIVYIKPISNIQILNLSFEIDESNFEENTKSLELIAYTLKRGQKYSLFENLKNSNLAEDLDIDVSNIGYKKKLFSIDVKLTDLGLLNYLEVIKRCFESFSNLKISGTPKYLFTEMQEMNKLNYEYQSHIEAFDFVCDNATYLLEEDFQNYPKDKILAKNYSPKTVQEILNSLCIDNCQFNLIANPAKTKIKLDRKEKWMNAEYTISDLPKDFIAEIQKNPTNQNIRLPEPNTFIPTDLKIVEIKEPQKEPKKIVQNDFGKIFYSQDEKFHVPEVAWQFDIKDSLFSNEVKSVVLKELYIKALNDKLTYVKAAASQAGLSATIDSAPNGIKIKILGYSQKANLLLEDILKGIKNFHINKEEFTKYFSSLKKEYENQQKILPVLQAKNYLSSVLLNYNLPTLEKQKTLDLINFNDFEKFSTDLFNETYIEGFLSGNLTLKDSEGLWVDIKDVLGKKPFKVSDQYKKKIFVLSKNGPFLETKKTPSLGNGVILTIDEGEQTFENQAAQSVLSQVLKEAFFTSLRSDQKTGYYVAANDYEIEKRLFQMFLVQSNSHDGFDLITRFEIFIEDFLDNIETKIPENRFKNIKENLITELSLPFKNLYEQANKQSRLAFEYNEDFSLNDKKISGLKDLSYKDFIRLSNEFLSHNNKRRFALLFEGKIDKDFRYKPITQSELNMLGSYK
ncbi:MAG: insulinase family protein [Parachlamydiales bacterium]|nr:insulinase family protein [Parachlamydiales bacterium]